MKIETFVAELSKIDTQIASLHASIQRITRFLSEISETQRRFSRRPPTSLTFNDDCEVQLPPEYDICKPLDVISDQWVSHLTKLREEHVKLQSDRETFVLEHRGTLEP